MKLDDHLTQSYAEHVLGLRELIMNWPLRDRLTLGWIYEATDVTVEDFHFR